MNRPGRTVYGWTHACIRQNKIYPPIENIIDRSMSRSRTQTTKTNAKQGIQQHNTQLHVRVHRKSIDEEKHAIQQKQQQQASRREKKENLYNKHATISSSVGNQAHNLLE